MLLKIEDTRRGRSRTRWMDGVKEAAGIKIRQMKEKAKVGISGEKRLWGSP